MANSVQEFLESIGPRALTPEEARQLQILRLKEGGTGNSGTAGKIAEGKKDGKTGSGAK